MASKRSKVSRASRNSNSVDRISSLPDSILLLILSMLPFESAVCTSVLSKRWKPLYMSLSHLRIDNMPCDLQLAPDFKNSIDRVLMHRPVNLDLHHFSLLCWWLSDPTRVNQWIRKVLEFQVKDFSLEIASFSTCELIPEMYTYGGFETLSLAGNFLVDIPCHIRFSSLRVLKFCVVKFSSYDSVKELLLKCPVLEEFVMDGCESLSGSCLHVCGSALKNLVLMCNKGVKGDTARLQIVLDTPGLETLQIGDSLWADIFVKGPLLSLRTAFIAIWQRPGRFECNNSVFRLVDNIYRVKFLTLVDNAVEVLDRASGYRLPTFHSLIQLTLDVQKSSCWKLLPNILASSPKLQSLLLPSGLSGIHTFDEDNYGLWSSPSAVPECLSSHLETVKIRMFMVTDDELSLVAYLLLEGKVLRNMSIHGLHPSQKSSTRKEVASFAKGSKNCKIDISSSIAK